MKLYVTKGIHKAIGSLVMEDIEFVSSNFAFPEVNYKNMRHTIDNGLIDDSMFIVFLDEKQLPEHIRVILQNRAISDIEEKTVFDTFPMEIIDNYQYLMDVRYTNNCVTDVYFRCEVLLAANWKAVCTNLKYKHYLEDAENEGWIEKNLSRMLCNYSAYGAECWDIEESYYVQNLITQLLDAI